MKGFNGFLPMQLAENADFGQFLDTLRNEHGIKTLDAVILDQDQSQFASQVKLMLEKDMLRKGSTIYVDNVATKKAKLKEYLTLVKGRDSKKFWSEPHEVSRPYEDAVLISTYLADSVEL
ncbi:unnamed protein product [Prorocentrum cordatum]|nr:unnamed protein product [Polarella glacialis]